MPGPFFSLLLVAHTLYNVSWAWYELDMTARPNDRIVYSAAHIHSRKCVPELTTATHTRAKKKHGKNWRGKTVNISIEWYIICEIAWGCTDGAERRNIEFCLADVAEFVCACVCVSVFIPFHYNFHVRHSGAKHRTGEQTTTANRLTSARGKLIHIKGPGKN